MEQKLIDGHQTRFKMKKYPLVHVGGLVKQKAYKFRAGYILRIVYSARNEAYIFNGICIAVRSGFKNPNLSLIVRNIILGVGIEMIFSYFGNRLFKLYIDFFKRKHRSLHRAKFFYIRFRINRSSRVKS